MANQRRDLSSEDESSEASSEEKMETSSDEESSEDERSTFELPVLQSDNETVRKTSFASYLKNKNNFSKEKKSLLMKKSKQAVASNFATWWESLDHSRAKRAASSYSLPEQNPSSENGLYESWFHKSSTSTDTATSWLCGPETKTSVPDAGSYVEDIEVPSIYDAVSLSKPKSRNAMKKERREQRNKTLGKKWYDMKQAEMDNKTKMDMELLQMRRALDPKKFFKQNDRRGLPKYFQLGTVVDEGTDFYSSRLTKKERKQTLVEELMADAKIRKYNKKKYEEIQQKQRFKKSAKKSKS